MEAKLKQGSRTFHIDRLFHNLLNTYITHMRFFVNRGQFSDSFHQAKQPKNYENLRGLYTEGGSRRCATPRSAPLLPW